MIYLDTSVALAQVFGEDRRPSDEFWKHELISSRLLIYETWIRIHALELSESHSQIVRSLTDRVALIELAPPILERALQSFPRAVRTLDALHLASLDFLLQKSIPIQLATYDKRMIDTARALDFPLLESI